MIDAATSLVALAVSAGASLVYAALGETLTERAGVLNLGVEGIMLTGAFAGFATALHTGSPALGVAAAAGSGAALGLVHAFLCVALRAEQVVSGLALNVFCLGLTAFLGTQLVGKNGPDLAPMPVPGLAALPLLGPVFSQDALVYGAYALTVVAVLFFRRTRAGLIVRAVGEDPATVDAMGASVGRWRFAACIAGGALIGIGGAHLSLAYTPGWSEGMTAGRGWIAVALVVFASWSPLRATFGALLFGGVGALQFRLQAMGVGLPAAVLNMLPYLATLGVLIATRLVSGHREAAPAALGKPYFREER
jgi:simple sugar transport system permease protein